MTTKTPPPAAGPIERGPWPTRLRATVFEPGPHPRAHGLDVYRDLAQHYGFAELVLTLLTGQPPSREHGALFDAVLSFCSPSTVAETPGHCAVVARTCRARWSAVVATGAIALAEQSASVLATCGPLLAWLEHARSSAPVALPPSLRCADDVERAQVEAFADRVARAGASLEILAHDPGLLPAVLAAAHHCGLHTREQLETVLVLARLPAVLAEASRPAGDLRAYPMNLPRFVHEPPEPDGEADRDCVREPNA